MQQSGTTLPPQHATDAELRAADVPMRSLWSSLVKRSVGLHAVRIPKAQCSEAIKALSRWLPKNADPPVRGVPMVQSDPEHGADRILTLWLPREQPLPAEVAATVDQLEGASVSHVEVNFGVDQMPLPHIVRLILPPHVTTVPSSFEKAGHIAHLNLRESALPWKHQIGDAVLAKNKDVRTVVNKVGSIHAKYRTFDMELLAGVPEYHVQLSETDCTFEFDFRKVYWNSRLQMEHRRVVDLMGPHDVVCDMFAGVGPFAVPIGKRWNMHVRHLASAAHKSSGKGTPTRMERRTLQARFQQEVPGIVVANDLNPESVSCLMHNIRGNKVGNRVKAWCMDARDFVRAYVSGSLPPSRGDVESPEVHVNFVAGGLPPPTQVLMNLPGSAHAFLDVFVGLYRNNQWGSDVAMPRIHCYTFVKDAQDPIAASIAKCGAVVSFDLSTVSDVHVHQVRCVSVRKYMMCVSFTLPRSVAFSEEAAPVIAHDPVDDEDDEDDDDDGDGVDDVSMKDVKA